MPHLNELPWQVGVPLAIVLWAMWLWMHYEVKGRLQDYFAHRRHVRRLRNYARYDVRLTAQMYPKKKRMSPIESRSRR